MIDGWFHYTIKPQWDVLFPIWAKIVKPSQPSVGGYLHPMNMLDKIHLTLNFKSKVSRDVSKTKMSVNWHPHFIPKCHLNFWLTQYLRQNNIWITNMQPWFVTKKIIKNNQSSVSILQSHMFLQILEMLAQSIA